MAKLRTIQDIQNELGQHTFGLGEVEFNYSQYENNRSRIVEKIKDLTREMELAQKTEQEKQMKAHEEAIKKASAETTANGAGPHIVPEVPQTTEAPLQ